MILNPKRLVRLAVRQVVGFFVAVGLLLLMASVIDPSGELEKNQRMLRLVTVLFLAYLWREIIRWMSTGSNDGKS